MLTHVVLFKLLDNAPDKVTETLTRIRDLQGKVPQLRSLTAGADVLHTERSYDLALITTFDSVADLQSYKVHPEHMKLLEYLSTVLDLSIVVDFES